MELISENLWTKVKSFFAFQSTPTARDDQQHVMTQEEALDQTIDDSFPASDPPGHFSVTAEDKSCHYQD